MAFERVAVRLLSRSSFAATAFPLAANMLAVFPRSVVVRLVGLLFIANTINIGADLAAMGAASKLLVGSGQHFLTLAFAIATGLSVVFIP